jgi:hypothetical protein
MGLEKRQLHPARLLFRMADGKLVKRYFDDIPEWSEVFLLK